jgi:hypothetical protein
MKPISKKFWYSSAVIVALLFFSGCRRSHQNPVPVRGIYWDYCSEKPLVGFKMQLVEFGNNFWGSNEYREIIAETRTDANGHYDFGAPELDDRERYNYRVFAVLESDRDSLNSGVGNAAPWYVKNTNGSPRLNKESENWDTLRACGFNTNPGHRYFILPSNSSQIDSFYLTAYHRYSNSSDINRIYLTYNDLVAQQNLSATFPINFCGNWYFKKEKRVNGVWQMDYDTINVKWKANPAFNDTINWDW